MVQTSEKNQLYFEFKVRIIIKPKHKPSVFKLFHNNGLKIHIEYASAPTFIHQLQFCPQRKKECDPRYFYWGNLMNFPAIKINVTQNFYKVLWSQFPLTKVSSGTTKKTKMLLHKLKNCNG